MSMSWTPRPLSAGVAPITPDDPVSIEAYEAMIAAMDEMIAQGDSQPVQEARGEEVT